MLYEARGDGSREGDNLVGSSGPDPLLCGRLRRQKLREPDKGLSSQTRSTCRKMDDKFHGHRYDRLLRLPWAPLLRVMRGL
jgi:hypothetical protein